MMNADQGGKELDMGRMHSRLERSKIEMAMYGHASSVIGR